MTRSVRMLCAVLFLGTTTCSLVFSASATITKAASVHVPSTVTWSAIGFLELLSLAGTMRWLTATTRRGRTHAIVVVAAAAVVTGQAGYTFYGWWGTLAPLAVVGTIHMVAETLNDLESVAEGSGVKVGLGLEPPKVMWEPTERPLDDDDPEVIAAEPWGAPETVPDIDWSLSERKLAMNLGITRHAARQLKLEREAAS